MKQAVITMLLLLVLGATCSSEINARIYKTHKASHQTAQSVFLQGTAICSATAIGPQALLTATHCERPTEALVIRGFKDKATIVGRIRDGNDHTIYLLQNVHFKDYLQVDLNYPLQQGEDVFLWGNPGKWSDQLRKGYVTGEEKQGDPHTTLYDLNGWHGDSGAGIINTQGKLIAVMSVIETQGDDSDTTDTIKLSGSFAFAFKQSDIDKAQSFSVPDTSKE